MSEMKRVRAVKYAPGHKHYPDHPSKPGGPLVRLPGSNAPDQLYVGWSRERIQPTLIDHPTKLGVKIEKIVPEEGTDGKLRMQYDIVVGDNGKPQMLQRPAVYRWVYDPTPLEIELSPENDYIKKALRAGDLEEVIAPVKAKKGGE